MAGYVRALKNPDGTPAKRRDGTTRWQARYWDPNDPLRRIEKVFRGKREAERWLTRQSADLLDGTHIDPRRGDKRLSVVVDEWRETWADLAPKTAVGYESIVNKHVLPRFGRAKVAAISPEMAQRFVNDISKTHAPNTVRRVYGVLRSVMTLAVERRYIAVNPCNAVKLPRKGEARTIVINPLTHAELNALVAALPDWWCLPVLLDAYTGLRAGELWALRRRDVDLLRGEIGVDEALKEVTVAAAADLPAEQRLTDSLVVGPTKTYARRKVSVPAFLRPLLAEHLSRSLRGGDGPEAFIFTTPTGEPVRHNLFYKRVFRQAVKATFPGRELRFHDLRHTCAAWLIAAGAHPLQIKLRLGHKEIRTTMDTYGHLFPSAEPELADLLDAGYRSADASKVHALA